MASPSPDDKLTNEGDTTDDPFEETRIVSPADRDAGAGRRSSGEAETEPSRTDSIAEGRLFGNYELLEEIARGGMGVVYRARQTTLNRVVAVKMILGGQLASAEHTRRFLVEAEAAAHLTHPGIVPVYEYGEHEGTHFFSMAYVDGPSLADRVADRSLDARQTAVLVKKIAVAVAYAHDHGVIHRDLKPANILLENGDEPRIADFGLAKRTEDDSELTKSGTIMGSIFYMSPEQASGRLDQIGPGSDVYALGAILYRLLTGRPPFQAASTVETINQVLADPPVPLRRLNSRIPRDLETICLKCLEKDVARRYRTADELVDELERFLVGEPIQARPLGRTAQLWRWCERNPLSASLAGGLVVVLLVGAVTATTLWHRAQAERQRAQDQQQMVHVLSELVLRKTLDETGEWLELFFEPVEQGLLIAREWGRNGLLDTDRTDPLNELLAPLIEHQQQISSVMVADERGHEHMLLSIDPPDADGETPRAWSCRITRRDQWDDRVRWVRWSDPPSVPPTTAEEASEYDPRVRPWFQGAVERFDATEESADLNEDNRAHWTEPYTFFTTKDLGITASLAFAGTDSRTQVMALDVLLQDVTRFTVHKHPTPNGHVLVLTDDGRLIGLPQAFEADSPEQWKRAFLKRPEDLGLDVIADAADQFAFEDDDPRQIHRFRSDGRPWWAGLQRFHLSSDHSLWILVIVPESDLRSNK